MTDVFFTVSLILQIFCNHSFTRENTKPHTVGVRFFVRKTAVFLMLPKYKKTLPKSARKPIEKNYITLYGSFYLFLHTG